jgi:hypothetical protein
VYPPRSGFPPLGDSFLHRPVSVPGGRQKGPGRATSAGRQALGSERVRAVLDNSRAKGNVLGGPLKDRTARERMAVLRAEVSASARSRAEKGGASGVLQILRRVESGVNT